MSRITTEQMIALLNIARMQSVCADDQVGAVLYHPHTNTLVYGYNHVLGHDGECCELPDGTTKPNVIHAEMHALHQGSMRIRKENFKECVLFVDRRPCAKCTPRIVEANIPVVVYYRGRPEMEHLSAFKEIGHGIKDADRLNAIIQSM